MTHASLGCRPTSMSSPTCSLIAILMAGAARLLSRSMRALPACRTRLKPGSLGSTIQILHSILVVPFTAPDRETLHRESSMVFCAYQWNRA
jgi:hypothetical protein